MFVELFSRDLDKVLKEVDTFSNESNLWKVSGSVKNSSGTLILHICGNLQHFIGATLGKSGYIRNREFEFSGTPVSKSHLIEEILTTKKVVTETLGQLSNEDMNSDYPLEVPLGQAPTEKVILHLFGHLSWHLGQVNYLRRILEVEH